MSGLKRKPLPDDLNAALRGRPVGMTICVHLCRGNAGHGQAGQSATKTGAAATAATAAATTTTATAGSKGG